MHFSPKIRHILPLCDNCEIKNWGNWSNLADSDSATFLICILTVAIFACVSGQRTSCLSHSLFFHSSPMKIRPGQAEKNEKTSSLYRLRQSIIAEKMKRCVPLRRNVAEKPRGMRLKFVLSQLRTCTHESKNMFVFFKSLRFYGQQESVESNPVKLGGVSFNLVPRSHSARGRSGHEIRGRLKH